MAINPYWSLRAAQRAVNCAVGVVGLPEPTPVVADVVAAVDAATDAAVEAAAVLAATTRGRSRPDRRRLADGGLGHGERCRRGGSRSR